MTSRVATSVCLARAFVLVAVAIACPQLALAGPFVIETVVGANLGCDPAGPYGGPGLCLNDEDPVDFQTFGPDQSYPPGVGAGFISIGDTYLLGNGDFMTAAAAADAQFGRLMTRASASYDLSSPETAGTFANAHVIDLLTIDAAGLTGTAGSIDVSYLLEGTISSSGAALAGVAVGVMWGGAAPFNQDDGAFSVHTTSTSETVTVSVPFTFGDPFFLAMIIASAAGTFEECANCDALFEFVPRTGAGAGSADFFNTMLLTGLLPRDANGDPVLNAVFSAASGTSYSVRGVVPEPGSLLLLGTGLVAVARRWRRRTRSRDYATALTGSERPV